MRIRRYLIEHSQKTTLNLPQGALIIRAATLDGNMYLWAYENPGEPHVPRHFGVFPDETDQLPDGLVHVGSVTVGAALRHIFEYFDDLDDIDV